MSRRRNYHNNTPQRTSNGPYVQLKGTVAQLCRRYQELAEEARSGGNDCLAENYFQHAEHYTRMQTDVA